MRRENLATGGAIGASLLIASCCLAPAIFLLFGISLGALGALSGLEPYRPIFIAAGGLALLYAAWRIHRTAPTAEDAACADGACAPGGPARSRARRLLAGALLIYGLSIVYPYALEAFL